METCERVRTRVEVVKEILFHVMSVIYVQIRGRESEFTTTPDHFHSDFHLQLCYYWSGFTILFPCFFVTKT